MFTKHTRFVWLLLGCVSSMAGARRAPAQTAALVTTLDNDTLSFERYARHGNVVAGSWVVLHAPGVYVHDYRITLGPDGRPVHYSMKYTVPLADTPPGLDSVIVDYARDTVTYTFIRRDSTLRRTVALHEAFPFLGQSVVGLDLALRRLRAAHADSGTIVAHETSNLTTPPRNLAVRFAGDSAYVGQSVHAHIMSDGGLVDMNDGRVSVHAAPSLDVAQLTKHFVDEYTPRAAAMRQAAASRVEIALPTAQLDRFVGSYGRGALSVTRDGTHLILALPQAKLTLLAMSQTEFFVRAPDLVVTFDVDAGGAISGLTVGQGENKQHLGRDNR